MRRYVPACATRVAGGMKVWTDTDDVRAVRRMALELLLSNHRGDCIAPCQTECPASVDVQGYIALIAQGQYREAAKLVKQVNPFPLSIGRVCPRPCEKECRRNAVDGPVGIDYLKRFAADWDADHENPYVPPTAPPTGKRVAMVGAGPASLTAAYYLAQKGHAVTVFEALPQAGGALRYGIPEYRLPKTVLDREIGLITALGIEIVYGKALGRDFTIADLFAQGFGAVFLGFGAVASRKMEVTGEELPGVWSGTEFLTDIALGKSVAIGKRVAIVGGGNTAIDAARTCVRLGAEKVTVVYRRSRNEMPAWDVEVEAAEHEGVAMHFLAAPTAIEGERACGLVTCVRMELGEPDASGRRRPVVVKGSEFKVEADTVIAAIGQFPDLAAIRGTAAKDPDSPEAKLALTKWGTIVADEETLVTSVPARVRRRRRRERRRDGDRGDRRRAARPRPPSTGSSGARTSRSRSRSSTSGRSAGTSSPRTTSSTSSASRASRCASFPSPTARRTSRRWSSATPSSRRTRRPRGVSSAGASPRSTAGSGTTPPSTAPRATRSRASRSARRPTNGIRSSGSSRRSASSAPAACGSARRSRERRRSGSSGAGSPRR